MIKKPIETDSQKIRLIPELVDSVALLHRVIVTGNVETGDPGILENLRTINKSLASLMEKQTSIIELEKRIKYIEDRHARLDERAKKRDAYSLAMFSVVLTNILLIVLFFLGFK